MEKLFAVTAPGLEAVTAAELRRLDLLPETPPASDPRGGDEAGGVAFGGGWKHVWQANLELRTASRILLRFGEFDAVSFPELRRKASRLPWENYLRPGQPVRLRVTCHKSRLYHSTAVGERILGAIGDHLGQPSPLDATPEDAAETPTQLILVRLLNDQVTVSIDSSGHSLHRRGYRLAVAKAPLRETLAAAMILGSGWDLAAPFLDPFCGSGTLAIEAALLALDVPPGAGRRFAFMDWPGFDTPRWQELHDRPRQPRPLPVIQASDRDAGAIQMAQANAARAGVAEQITFTCQAVSHIHPPQGPGWVVTNPPYGVRVSAAADLRNLYAQFGRVLRRSCPGWQLAFLGNDPALTRQLELRLQAALSTTNGGIPVHLLQGRIPGGE